MTCHWHSVLREDVVRSGWGKTSWHLHFISSSCPLSKVKCQTWGDYSFRSHVSGGYSDSLRCYGGKGGGKFQECHQDDGYKTCFTKYENGKLINIAKVQNNFCHISRSEGGAGLRYQETHAVRGVRGAQEQERAGGVLLLLLRPLQHLPRPPRGQGPGPRPHRPDPRLAVSVNRKFVKST